MELHKIFIPNYVHFILQTNLIPQVLYDTSRPSPEWGPARKRDRQGVYAMPRSLQPINPQPEPPPYWLSTSSHTNSLTNLSKPPSYNGNGNGMEMGYLKKRTNKPNSEESKDTSASSTTSIEVEINQLSTKSRKSTSSGGSMGKAGPSNHMVTKISTTKAEGKQNPAFVDSDEESETSSVGSSPVQYNMEPDRQSNTSGKDIPTHM